MFRLRGRFAVGAGEAALVVSGDRVESEPHDVAHLVPDDPPTNDPAWPTGWPHSGTISRRTNLKCGFSAMFCNRARTVQLLLFSNLGCFSQPPFPVKSIGSLVQSQRRQHRRMRAHTSVCRPGTACRLDIHGSFTSHHLLIQIHVPDVVPGGSSCRGRSALVGSAHQWHRVELGE